MKNQSKMIEELVSALQKVTQDISVERLTKYSGVQDIQVSPLPLNHDMSYDHWICMVLIVAPGLQIAIRCHFSSKTARLLASTVLGQTAIESNICQSFMGEYCNLVGGAVKSALANAVIHYLSQSPEIQFSVPSTSPSFDLGIPKADVGTRKTLWRLSWNEGHLAFSTEMAIDDKVLSTSYNGNLENVVKDISSIRVFDNGDVDWF